MYKLTDTFVLIVLIFAVFKNILLILSTFCRLYTLAEHFVCVAVNIVYNAVILFYFVTYLLLHELGDCLVGYIQRDVNEGCRESFL